MLCPLYLGLLKSSEFYITCADTSKSNHQNPYLNSDRRIAPRFKLKASFFALNLNLLPPVVIAKRNFHFFS
jgi:hypothetical protein